MNRLRAEGLARRWRSAAAAGFAATLACACSSEESSSEPSAPPPAERSLLTTPSTPTPNQAPEIRSLYLEPSRPLPGDRVSATVEASDPEGDDFELGFTWRVGDRPVPGGEPQLVVPETAGKRARVEVTVIASDGRATSEPARSVVYVRNRPPEWQTLYVQPPEEALPGMPVALVAEATDPDGDPVEVRYSWFVNGKEVAEQGSSLATDDLRRGDRIQVRAEASDGEQAGATFTSNVVRVANSPPRIVSAPASVTGNATFRYRVEVEDPDGDRNFRFRLAEGPPGMQIDEVLGEVTWETDGSLVGRYEVEVVASDPYEGIGRQRFELVVSENSTAPPTPADATP